MFQATIYLVGTLSFTPKLEMALEKEVVHQIGTVNTGVLCECLLNADCHFQSSLSHFHLTLFMYVIIPFQNWGGILGRSGDPTQPTNKGRTNREGKASGTPTIKGQRGEANQSSGRPRTDPAPYNKVVAETRRSPKGEDQRRRRERRVLRRKRTNTRGRR